MEDNIKLKNKLQSLLTIADPELRHKSMLEISEKLEVTIETIEETFSQVWLVELENRVQILQNKDLDYATRLLKKESISNWLRNFIADKKDRQTIIDQMMMEKEPVKIYTLADLKAMRKKRRSKYYVTGLLQPGLYLMVAQAKCGKTLLALSGGVSLMRGTKFLNRQTLQSNVMVLENEEELSSTGAKIDNHGLQDFERQNPEEYRKLVESHRLIVVRDLDICTDRDKIFNIVDEYNINVLIVDSFRASIAKSGLTEMDLGAAMALYQLQSGIHERNMLCLVIHHANKSDNNDGQTSALKGVGGHNSIIGANDGIIKMLRNAEKKHDGRETIDVHFYPRNDTPSSFNLHYSEKEACEWGFEVLEESVLSPTMVKAICEVLIALDEPYQDWLLKHFEDDNPPLIFGKNIEDLLIDTNIEKRELVRILNYLDHNEAVGRYSQGRKWVYHIPREGSDMFYLVEDHKEKEEGQRKFNELVQIIFQRILDATSVDELDKMSEELDEEVRAAVRKSAPYEVQKHITYLRYPPSFAVGDKVSFKNTDATTLFVVEDVVYTDGGKVEKMNRFRYKLKGMEEPADGYELQIAEVAIEKVDVEVVNDDNDIDF